MSFFWKKWPLYVTICNVIWYPESAVITRDQAGVYRDSGIYNVKIFAVSQVDWVDTPNHVNDQDHKTRFDHHVKCNISSMDVSIAGPPNRVDQKRYHQVPRPITITMIIRNVCNLADNVIAQIIYQRMSPL